jgi:hypothetical protein
MHIDLKPAIPKNLIKFEENQPVHANATHVCLQLNNNWIR